ncbi:MAG: uL15 family ribosomal protein [Nanoarchaeota archaeon]
MSYRKRRKSSRYPGSKTHGRGRKNRTRGLGNRGGRGMSGTGKRGDQKKTLIIKLYGGDYFGKEPRGAGTREKKKTKSLSLATLKTQLRMLVEKGKAREVKGTYEVNLEDYKIVGNGTLDLKMHIKAKSASAGARQAVERAGGSLVVTSEKEKAN